MREISVEIFQATEDDWAMWRDMRVRCLRSSPDAFGRAWETERDYTEDDWRRWLSDQTAPCFLARVQGETVAMSGVRCHGDGQASVRAMWTVPHWRGRGLGGRMLDTAVEWGRERGLSLDLWVATGNDTAKRLYESRGFEETGDAAPIRPGSAQTKLRMALREVS